MVEEGYVVIKGNIFLISRWDRLECVQNANQNIVSPEITSRSEKVGWDRLHLML